MSTTLNNKKTIQEAFQNLLEPASREEKLELETLMLSTKFLSEIERVCQNNNIRKKDLAGMIGTSPSFITQLFRGNKIVNLETIAKIQLALGISFDIKLAEAQDDAGKPSSKLVAATRKHKKAQPTANIQKPTTNIYFTALIKETEDGWFYGQIEEVPEAMSQGKSIDELVENLSDALSLVLQLRREETRERFKGQTYITRKIDLT
jgi:predicted RNase H-like HicB family nuclease/ribosome-binding protein aMBF1 (putative translation factor)